MQPARPPLVYVDQPIFQWRGRAWCHMWSEDVAVLHEFARGLGMRMEWFQGPPKASWFHYDVTAEKRLVAIRKGAVETDKYGAAEHVARIEGDMQKVERIVRLRERFGIVLTGQPKPPAQLDLF